MPKYRFSEIAFNSTAKKKPTEADKDTYIGLEHLDAGNLAVTRWGADVAPVGEKLIMKRGDVLFGKRRAYQKKVAIAPFDGIFSAHGMVLRPNESVVTKEYFPLFLSSDYFLDEAIRISVGSLSPTINWKDLKELTFNIPNIDEQKRITPLVWAAIEAKNAYKALLERTDDLVKSQFIEMFGAIPESEFVTMESVCSLITDGTHQPPKFVDNGIPFLFVSNITTNELTYDADKFISSETYADLMKRTPVEIGDILLSTVGSYGHPAVVKSDRKFSFQRHIAFLKPRRDVINSIYLHGVILTSDIQRQIDARVKGIAQKTLNLSEIRTLRFPLPPMKEQNRFAAFVAEIDKSKFELKQSIERIDNLIKSLIQQG